MEEKKTVNYVGFSIHTLCIVLFFVFLILKCCSVIDWSWVIVCIPLMVLGGLWALGIILIIFSIVLAIICGLFKDDF